MRHRLVKDIIDAYARAEGDGPAPDDELDVAHASDGPDDTGDAADSVPDATSGEV